MSSTVHEYSKCHFFRFLWLALLAVRIIAHFDPHTDWDPAVSPKDDVDEAMSIRQLVSEVYTVIWAFQTTSLTARTLVLFQTSEYFGLLLRMIYRLLAEMAQFMFVLGVILLGFLWGLYYIQGAHGYEYENDELTEDFSYPFWDEFKYLFILTVCTIQRDRHI